MAKTLSDDDRDEMAIPSYLHKNPAMRWMAWRRVEVVAEHLARALESRDSAVVVDFGCGSGVLLGEASRQAAQVYGVDLVLEPASLLVEEWKLDNVELLPPTDAADAIKEASVDVIIAAEVLEHVEPLGPTMEQFRRWLRPDGVLLTSLPTENRLYRLGRRLAGFSGHYHHANAASIDRELRDSGFGRRRIDKIPLGGPMAIYWAAEYSL